MKNWTVKEAAQVIRENKDAEAIKEIVKHFPLFAVIVAGRDFDGLTDAMPDHLTVRKIENELNNGTADAEDVDADDEAEDTEDSGKALEDMTKNELIALCEKKGLKVQKHQKPKQYYIDALNGADDEESEKAVADDDEEEEDDPVALYKKCKKAGLKVAPKKSAKYYKDQLAKAAEAEQSDEDDDWDDEDEGEDEEQAEEKPKKSVKKPAKKAPKKPTKKEQPEEEEDDEEDDDEWDI